MARAARTAFASGRTSLYVADCLDWLAAQPPNTIHGVVTDPPYGLVEYTAAQQQKLRRRRGGVWRIPPSFDGHTRAPLPRFTTLTPADLAALDRFFFMWAAALMPVLVPGAHVVIASNPLVSYMVAGAAARAGLERRGEIVRLVMTMRRGTGSRVAGSRGGWVVGAQTEFRIQNSEFRSQKKNGFSLSF